MTEIGNLCTIFYLISSKKSRCKMIFFSALQKWGCRVKQSGHFEIISLMRQSLFFLGANAEKGQLWVLYYVFIVLLKAVSYYL